MKYDIDALTRDVEEITKAVEKMANSVAVDKLGDAIQRLKAVVFGGGVGGGGSGAAALPQAVRSIFNVDVSALPVHPYSAGWIASMGRGPLKADFGSGLWEGAKIGIPITKGTLAAREKFTFNYADESDNVPYPVGEIEGNSTGTGDRHSVYLDTLENKLYEMHNVDIATKTAGSGAVFDLNTLAMRAWGWTSADAAGLPIMPLLVTKEEVDAGEIKHPIRITASKIHGSMLPASHMVKPELGMVYPDWVAMGAWARLKADFDITPYPFDIQVILKAMKKHGVIVADVGSDWYFSGVPDESWVNDNLGLLKKVVGSDFDFLDTSSLGMTSKNYLLP